MTALNVLTPEEKQDATLAEDKPWLLKIRLTLGGGGMRWSQQLLREKFSGNGNDTVTARHTKPVILAPVYISGIMSSTFSNMLSLEAVLFADTILPVIQCAVVLATLYRNTTGRLDTVFIKKDYKVQSCRPNDSSFLCWSAKVFWFSMIVRLDVSH